MPNSNTLARVDVVNSNLNKLESNGSSYTYDDEQLLAHFGKRSQFKVGRKPWNADIVHTCSQA
jgi:hypothetical protein